MLHHKGQSLCQLSQLDCFSFPLQNSNPQTEAPKEIIVPSPRPASHPQPLKNPSASAGKGNDATGVTLPKILISDCRSHSDLQEEAGEETETEKKSQSVAAPDSSESCSQDSDNPLTSHFKMIFRGLTRSRSQESLISTRNASDDDPLLSDCMPHYSQNGGLHGEGAEGPSWLHFSAKSHKKEKMSLKSGSLKSKGKDQGTLTRGEDSQFHKSQVNWEQLETTKAIFDLLKEISGWLQQEFAKCC